jgi:hypothetical protein
MDLDEVGDFISDDDAQFVSDDYDMSEAYGMPEGYGMSEGYGTHERIQYNIKSNPTSLIQPPSAVVGCTPRSSRSATIRSNSGGVDLSLASSYLPGIYAMMKVLVLLSALNIMQKLGMRMDQAIIVCAACLYIDRCMSICYIMDTGACALCVLVSVCVNASRIGIDGDVGIVNISISICWVVVSALILCDSHLFMLRNVQLSGIINGVTSSFCAVHGFLSIDVEMDWIAYMRAFVFAVLAVLWTYTLNLRFRRDMSNDSFSSCVDRFAVVLVADIYVSAMYTIVACVVIAWRHRQSYVMPVSVAEVVCDVGASVPTVRLERRAVSTAVIPEIDTGEMDVHVAFRLAQENARKGARAR